MVVYYHPFLIGIIGRDIILYLLRTSAGGYRVIVLQSGLVEVIVPVGIYILPVGECP
ncbi:hypothetical protein Barb6_03731 [Bacteroidales bacterium Barb6]|nr:hypothetical protein Barb6_03731 [Bacteroidales bacterium Barb6]